MPPPAGLLAHAAAQGSAAFDAACADRTAPPGPVPRFAEHNQVRHEHVVIIALETPPMPGIPDAARIEIDDLGYARDGIVHVSARFG
jgi:K+ transporter